MRDFRYHLCFTAENSYERITVITVTVHLIPAWDRDAQRAII